MLILTIVLATLLVSVLIKLSTPTLLKNLLVTQTQEILKSTYNSNLSVSVESVNLKILDLLLLKPTMLIRKFRIGDQVIIENIETEVDLRKFTKEKTLYFKSLKVDSAEIIIDNDINLNGNTQASNSKKSQVQDIFFKEAELNKIDLIINSSKLENKKFEFRNLSLTFNDFALANNQDTDITNFTLESELKNYRNNGRLSLKGTFSGKSDYKLQGEFEDLDLQNFLTVFDNQKHALSGRLSAKKINYELNSKKSLLNAEIKLEESPNFLLEYIKNSILSIEFPWEKVANKSLSLGVNTPDDYYYKKTNKNSITVNAKLKLENNRSYLSNILINSSYFQVKNHPKHRQNKKSSFFSRVKNIF